MDRSRVHGAHILSARTGLLRLNKRLKLSSSLFNSLSIYPMAKCTPCRCETFAAIFWILKSWISDMNTSMKTALVAAIALLPALAFAQSSEPHTRGQVRAQLIQLEKAGYDPVSACSGDCPGSLRRAEAAVAQQRISASNAYGPAVTGPVKSGN